MNTIAITGAFGILGREVLKKFLEQNYNIIAIVKSTTKKPIFPEEIVRKIKVFNSDLEPIENLFHKNKIDCVIHTATVYGIKEEISEVVKTNVVFPVEIAEHAIKHRVKVFVNTDSYFTKFEDYDYLNGYTLSKNHLTDWLKTLSGIKILNLKIEHVYSENDTNRKFVNDILSKLYNKSTYIELTDGLQKRDFIHVSDVASYYLQLVKSSQALKKDYYDLEVGTGKSISVKDFVIKAKEIFLNNDTELRFGAIPQRKNEIMDSKANLSENEIKLTWKPKVSIEEGIKLVLSKWKN